MKNRGFLSTLFAIMVLSALPLTISTAEAGSDKYSAQLLSPVTGQVLYAGQKIMVEWKHTLPNIPITRVRERGLAVAGWRHYVSCVDRVARPKEYILPLDCPKYAYQRGGLGHPLRM